MSQAPLSQFVTTQKVGELIPIGSVENQCKLRRPGQKHHKTLHDLRIPGIQIYSVYCALFAHPEFELVVASPYWKSCILPLNSKLQTAKTAKVPSRIPVTSLDRLISSGPFCHSEVYCNQFCRCFKILNQNENWKQVSGLVPKEIQQFAKVLSEILVIATPSSPILTSYSLTDSRWICIWNKPRMGVMGLCRTFPDVLLVGEIWCHLTRS